MSTTHGGKTAEPPKIAALQLALRFALELSALIAWGTFARRWGVTPALRYLFGWGVPAALAAVWGTFAVRGDPSRSGNAPVAVPGLVRLALEWAVLLGGAATLALRHSWLAFGLFMLGFVVHHAMTGARLRWLLRQPEQ